MKLRWHWVDHLECSEGRAGSFSALVWGDVDPHVSWSLSRLVPHKNYYQEVKTGTALNIQTAQLACEISAYELLNASRSSMEHANDLERNASASLNKKRRSLWIQKLLFKKLSPDIETIADEQSFEDYDEYVAERVKWLGLPPSKHTDEQQQQLSLIGGGHG